jgi:hypothetical protein
VDGCDHLLDRPKEFEILRVAAKRPIATREPMLLDGKRAGERGDYRGQPRADLILGGSRLLSATRAHRDEA